MVPTLLGLLATCKADPDDDTPRLILADWLDDYGDEADQARACLIRTQCELARPGHSPSVLARLDRKLLAHKKEIDLIERRAQEKGLTIVPTKIYFTRGKVKVEIALGRGKRQYDRREQIAKDESRREADRARKERF